MPADVRCPSPKRRACEYCAGNFLKDGLVRKIWAAAARRHSAESQGHVVDSFFLAKIPALPGELSRTFQMQLIAEIDKSGGPQNSTIPNSHHCALTRLNAIPSVPMNVLSSFPNNNSHPG